MNVINYPIKLACCLQSASHSDTYSDTQSASHSDTYSDTQSASHSDTYSDTQSASQSDTHLLQFQELELLTDKFWRGKI